MPRLMLARIDFSSIIRIQPLHNFLHIIELLKETVTWDGTVVRNTRKDSP